MVLLEGEPGIGKSSVLDWVVREALEEGIRVFGARGQELKSRRPFGILLEALKPALKDRESNHEAVTRIAEESSQDDIGAAHFRMADALTQLIEEETLLASVLLSLDDVQWADVSTLHALATLPARLPYSPLMLLGAMRPSPRAPELDRLILAATESGGRLIRLGPLSESDVRELTERRVTVAPGPILLDHVARAAGNPLLIREVIDSLEQEGLLEISGEVAEAREAKLPRDLNLTILRRISFLSSETIALLRLGSVLGSRFAPAVLAGVAGKAAAEILPAIDEAIRNEILTEDGDELRFRHDLIREALYEEIPRGVRRTLHREVAIALRSRAAPQSEVAEHFALGASPGDDEAISALRDAARTTLAPETRVSLLSQAYELATPENEYRETIGADLVEALVWAGHLTEGERLADDLLAQVHDERLRRILWENKLRSLSLASRWEAVIELSTTRLARPEVQGAESAIWLAHRAIALTLGPKEAQQASTDAKSALALADPAHGDRVRVLALDALTLVSELQFRRGDSVRYGQEAADIAENSTDPDVQRFHTDAWFGATLTNALRLDEGLLILKEGVQQRLASGVVWDVPIYHHMLGLTYLHLGRWDDAIAALEAALASAQEIGTRVFESMTRLLLARIALYQDRLSDAAAHIELIKMMQSDLGPQPADPRGLEASLKAAHGDTDGALTLMTQLIDEGAVAIAGVLMDWISILLGAGEIDLARRAVRVSKEKVRPQEGDLPEGRLVASQALLEGDLAGIEESIRVFEMNRNWLAAVSKEFAARVLAQQGRMVDARKFASAALETYNTLGAEHLARRTTATMRSMGIRIPRRTKGLRPAFGWESLTNAELKVAELTAEGLTNAQIGQRLFLSRYTVQTHLKHIFAKLEISSRVELASEVARNRG